MAGKDPNTHLPAYVQTTFFDTADEMYKTELPYWPQFNYTYGIGMVIVGFDVGSYGMRPGAIHHLCIPPVRRSLLYLLPLCASQPLSGGPAPAASEMRSSVARRWSSSALRSAENGK